MRNEGKKRYPKYKDSGIPWIGEIPEHWEVKKLKYVAKINPSKNKTIDKKSNELVTFLPMEKIREDGSIDCGIKKPVSELFNGFTFFRRGDIVIAKITPSFENGKGALLDKLDTEFGFGTTEFHVIRPTNVYNKFLYFITKSAILRKIGESFMIGAAGQKRVPIDFINNFFITLPPVSEQQQIVSYLDHKTAEIDTLIAKKERLLELYEEEKKAIINKAVTKGINPNVKMKDSSIQWLGEIPAHWEIVKLRFLCSITTGEKDTVDKDENGKYPFFVRSQVIEKISTYSYNGEAILTAGDGVGVGKVFHYINGKFDFHQRVYKLSDFKKITGIFLFYYMKSQFYNAIIGLSAKSTVDSLRLHMLQNFAVVIPPLKEQQEIVSYIEEQISLIDSKIEKTKKMIELLKEYKTSLISEIITGKRSIA